MNFLDFVANVPGWAVIIGVIVLALVVLQPEDE